MDTADVGSILVVICLVLIVVLVGAAIIDICIPSQWFQEIIIYNHTDPNYDDYVIATIDGEWKRIYLPDANDMGFEYGDPICVLVESGNVIPNNNYTIVDTCGDMR